MTDQEIIKALECLRGDEMKCISCACYRYRFPLCWQTAGRDALDLIARQQAEIKRWQEIHADAMEFLRIATNCRRSE